MSPWMWLLLGAGGAAIASQAACNAAPLPIGPPDANGFTPIDLSTLSPSCPLTPIPRCTFVSSGIKPCPGIMINLPAETLHGTYGPPSYCYQGDVTTDGFCQQDPTDVPGGYPYLVVKDCATCKSCPYVAPLSDGGATD